MKKDLDGSPNVTNRAQTPICLARYMLKISVTTPLPIAIDGQRKNVIEARGTAMNECVCVWLRAQPTLKCIDPIVLMKHTRRQLNRSE